MEPGSLASGSSLPARQIRRVAVPIGDGAVEVTVGESLCLRCRHFDKEAYEKDIVKGKKTFSMDACRSTHVLWKYSFPVACSGFEEGEQK
jgi:hypothetical protein